jgi:hypothetical protein
MLICKKGRHIFARTLAEEPVRSGQEFREGRRRYTTGKLDSSKSEGITM